MAHKQHLLDKLSTYDYNATLKRERKKRYGSTSEWLSKTSEYNSWLEGSSSCFWLSGIVGSGKTVLTAAILDELFYFQSPKGKLISFFFIQHDDAKSLQAATILRSLIRQCLAVDTLPEDIEDQLQHCFESGSPDMDHLLSIMKSLSDKSLIDIVVVDGFDECPKSERDLVLSAFKVLLASTASSIKLFVSSRPEIGREMDKSFVAYHHRTMSCREVHVDIANYIKFSIREKLVKEDLHVGDKNILSETIQALTKGAHGM